LFIIIFYPDGMPTDTPPPDLIPPHLTPATAQEIADALSYALRYDDRGKPRRNGWDFIATLAAERLAEHLKRAGFIILRTQSAPPHRAG
jgi:hypothetical protein